MTATFTSILDLRSALEPHRAQKTIALVPTMGNLHQGHISLVKLAKQQADIVVVSIFVNPTQFGVGEDLDSYPRTLDADSKLLAVEGVDYIFAPTVEEMYPVMPPPTQVLAGEISQKFCGQSRPTHFDGVGIVVTKLFNIVQPDVAVFGKKDYQQLVIIKQIVRDLSYDIKLIGGPIIRAEDGLALSSRNQYLSENERTIAPLLNKHIRQLAASLRDEKINSQTQLQALIDNMKEAINQSGFRVDYLEVVNQDLTQINDFTDDKAWVILVAAWLGKARLLDNQEV
ncbi:pantoate--beta-alanine ligase [Psychrobacter lutiphocae]|uniref:pantoate--beta-alanine ligase n=1 Tax=Psychrobacter lutiphocae TaxID=540500 RepID=UPI000379A601|nr:pantoate--beta-alanine ligase [Psychrobacter lutiphocae]